MKKIAPFIFEIGAVVALAGVVLFITRSHIAPYLYIVGAAMVLIGQILTPFHGDNLVIRRLHAQYVLGGVFLFVSSILMYLLHGNEWIICLAIACVFFLYSIFRMSYEEKKEEK